MSIDRVRLGDLEVSAQGLGCMGMSEWYGAADWDESVATIHRALDLGVTLVDTADVYGAGHNEVLVGRAIHGRRDEVAAGHEVRHRPHRRRPARVLRGDAAYVQAGPATRPCCASGVETIDLYYLHRPPQNAEIEETVGAMAELVAGRQGAPPRALRGRRRPAPPGARGAPDHRRADRVLARGPATPRRPSSARCVSWASAWSPYSPARPGLPHRHGRRRAGSAQGDFRTSTRGSPARPAPANQADRRRGRRGGGPAHGVTPAQVALAWVHGQGARLGVAIAPIPGTKRVRWLEQNVAALDLRSPSRRARRPGRAGRPGRRRALLTARAMARRRPVRVQPGRAFRRPVRRAVAVRPR